MYFIQLGNTEQSFLFNVAVHISLSHQPFKNFVQLFELIYQKTSLSHPAVWPLHFERLGYLFLSHSLAVHAISNRYLKECFRVKGYKSFKQI